jgi:ferredoxin--NADP+ reductase
VCAERNVLAVAVVGSGPSGFYVAGSLLDIAFADIYVDVFDRLATPWGLVRFGVAPDHPKIKSASSAFEKIAAHERFSFFGNVEVGTDITRDDLLDRFDAVVYATGAPRDRKLGVPGERLKGCVGAAELVAWYNGHPDFAGQEFDLTCERAVVVGNGNVALDVARILCSPPERLATTDIADHALDALRTSSIKEVLVIGRRGAAQAAFTTPEVKELAQFTESGVDVAAEEVAEMDGEDDLPRVAKRNLAVLREYAQGTHPFGERHVTIRFQRSPVELKGDGRVQEVVLAHNDLHVDEHGAVQAHDSGRRENVRAGLVVRAIGYRGQPIPGVPFDEDSGTISNAGGRVAGSEREYVVGWCKRGPQGIIGTNKADAKDTVDRMIDDLHSGPVASTVRPLERLATAQWLASLGLHVVSHDGWLRIDEAERTAGALQGRPRVKICHTEALLKMALGYSNPRLVATGIPPPLARSAGSLERSPQPRSCCEHPT